MSTSPPEPLVVNREIGAREVRVIDSDGRPLGVMSLDEALRVAADQELDLVEVSPNAVPPVCRIMDYAAYEQHLAERARELN